MWLTLTSPADWVLLLCFERVLRICLSATRVKTILNEIRVPNQLCIWDILSRNSMYPYHVQRVQGFSVSDYGPRLQFCQLIVNKINENPNFCKIILFTDKAVFARNKIFNYHNFHQWAVENLKTIYQKKH